MGCYDGTVLLSSSNQVIVTMGIWFGWIRFRERHMLGFHAGFARFLALTRFCGDKFSSDRSKPDRFN